MIREFYEKFKKIDPISIISYFLILGFLLYFLISGFLLYWYPPVQVSHFEIDNATTNATLENEYRATLVQILLGAVTVIGAYFGLIKYINEQKKTAKENQITDRFIKATDQLGAVDISGKPAMEIRLAGIYALERIAIESEKDYWTIMEILTAYVRNNSSAEKQDGRE